MAKMYPQSISEYLPTDSERLVYYLLKNQLPDYYEVFYSVSWSAIEKEHLVNSEADFIIVDPDQGFICLEVKGGKIRVQDNEWYVSDSFHGERKLNCSPYKQAEKSMYHFLKRYSNVYHNNYKGIYCAGVVFPFSVVSPDMEIDKRIRDFTIDSTDMDHIDKKIKRMFKVASNDSYGFRIYPEGQHKLFCELIKENYAIEAASGALVAFKERQLEVINRVQDNYVYLLKEIPRFLMRGGAGTGKTWIAMKMALDSSKKGLSTLFVCVSPFLSDMIREKIGSFVNVESVDSLFNKLFYGYKDTSEFKHNNLKKRNDISFDAIYVDEAQDLTEDVAMTLVMMLKDDNKSRLGVFFDEVQVLRVESFGNGFGDNIPIFYLNENIRNTSNIYNWASGHTKLGLDVVTNPVEGPAPTTSEVSNWGQLTMLLENIFRRFIDEENLSNKNLVLLVENTEEFFSYFKNGIAKWSFTLNRPLNDSEIQVSSVEDYKGLESAMVIYIHNPNSSCNMNYIAYTRAKFYLTEIIRRF